MLKNIVPSTASPIRAGIKFFSLFAAVLVGLFLMSAPAQMQSWKIGQDQNRFRELLATGCSPNLSVLVGCYKADGNVTDPVSGNDTNLFFNNILTANQTNGLSEAIPSTLFESIEISNAQRLRPTGINDNGTIIGWGDFNLSGNVRRVGFKRNLNGSSSFIQHPNFLTGSIEMRGINNAGDSVGFLNNQLGFKLGGSCDSNTASCYTFLRIPGSIADIIPIGINDAGEIVGDCTLNCEPTNKAFKRSSNGVYTFINYPGTNPGSTAVVDINNAGDILGSTLIPGSSRRNFKLSGGVYTLINPPPGVTIGGASGINDAGDVVGYAISGNASGYLLSGGNATQIMYPGSVETIVTGINNAGDMVGYYKLSDGVEKGFKVKNLSISGQIVIDNTPVGGVTVSLSGTTSATTTTDATGKYSFNYLTPSGSYTVQPTSGNIGFIPSFQTFGVLTTSQIANFVGTAVTTATISGQITRNGSALPGVSVALSGSASSTATTNSSGNYSFTVITNGNYTVTPTLAGNNFTPASQSFNLISSNQTANFTAALNTFTISGNVQADGANLQGATVSLTGSPAQSTTSNTNGNYSFNANQGGNYTVTVSKNGYVFAPANQIFNNLQANQTANFQNGIPLCTPPPANLTAWYRGEGNSNDSSGNNFNGTPQNGATYGTAKVGQGFILDGVNDWISVADNNALDGFAQMSAAVWVKFDSLPTNKLQFILAKSDTTSGAGTDAYSIFYDGTISPGKLKVILGNTAPATSPVVQTDFSDTAGFHLVAFTYDGATVKLYLDGVLKDSQLFTGTIMNTPYNLTIGRRSGNGNDGQGDVFGGKIDEVQIFGGALSTAQIQSIFVSGSVGVCSSNIAPTPSGNNVSSTPTSGINLNFQNVASGGTTVAIPITTNQIPAIPTGFTLSAGGPIYDIRTSASYTGSLTITFDVPNVADSQICAAMRLMHYENGAWTTNGNATPIYTAGTQTCTVSQTVTSLSPFVIVQSAPTAASVSVGGRILTGEGRGIRNVRVIMTAPNGETRTAISSSLGYYRFEDVPAGETYIFSVRAKQFNFNQATQVLTVQGDTDNINFVSDAP